MQGALPIRQGLSGGLQGHVGSSIVAIIGWHRFNVAFLTPAGNYKSAIMHKDRRGLALYFWQAHLSGYAMRL